MSLMFEKKKVEVKKVETPQDTTPSFIKDIASNPGKYLAIGGIVAGLIYLFTKVKTNKGVKI